MDITIDASDIQKLKERMDQDLDLYRRGLRLQMARALNILKVAIQQNIRTRSGLNVRSGALLNSIMMEIVESGDEISGTIGPRNVPYAAVHEFGHNFPARYVEPRNARVLAWGQGSDVKFSKGHWMPPFRVPARPYLAPAMEEKKDYLLEHFGLFLVDTFTKGK